MTFIYRPAADTEATVGSDSESLIPTFCNSSDSYIADISSLIIQMWRMLYWLVTLNYFLIPLLQ